MITEPEAPRGQRVDVDDSCRYPDCAEQRDVVPPVHVPAGGHLQAEDGHAHEVAVVQDEVGAAVAGHRVLHRKNEINKSSVLSRISGMKKKTYFVSSKV